MGKLQIRGGSGEVPQLSPREPYFDGENLHVGKLDGSGNKQIGGSSAPLGDSANIVEWVQGEPKPTVAADYLTGDFVEGRQHIVNTYAVDAGIVGVISVIGVNSNTYSSIEGISQNMDLFKRSGDYLYEVLWEETEPNVYENQIRRYSIATGLLDETFIDIPVFDSAINDILTSDQYMYAYGEFTGKLKRFSILTGEPDSAFNALMLAADLGEIMGLHMTDTALLVLMTPAKVLKFDLAGNEDLTFNSNIANVLDASDALNYFVFDDNTLVLAGEFGLLKINQDGTKNAAFETNLLSSSLVGIVGVVASHILAGTDAYFVIFENTVFRILKDGTPDENYLLSNVNFMNYVLPDNRLLISDTSGGVRLISADSNSSEEVYGGNAGRTIVIQNNLYVVDYEMVLVWDIDNSILNLPVMQKMSLSFDGYLAHDIIGLGNTFLVQVYDVNSGSYRILHFNTDGSLVSGYVDYFTEVINSYSTVKTLPNPVPEEMEEGTFTYIRSKGEYVFAGVPEMPGISLRIVTEKMKAGDKVKIYNLSGSGLSILSDMQILAGLNMQEITASLQPGNFAEFMYAGNGIGLLLYSTQNLFQSM